MFNNIGGKIKGLAKIVCWIEIIFSVIGGIIYMCIDEDFIGIGLSVAIVGSLMAWIGSFLFYGFGELIEKTSMIEEKLRKNADNVKFLAENPNPQTPTLAENPNPQTPNVVRGKCELCDAENVELINSKIVDEIGTRYRSICSDCFNKKNATRVD